MRAFSTPSSLRAGTIAAAFLLVALPLMQCTGPGSYIWIANLPPQPVEKEYRIEEGDLLEIRVFNQEPISTHARVRRDGRIAMPILGDVDVRGRSPAELKVELESRLKDYVNAPSVTVTITESHPITVSVLGEVSHQGAFPVDSHATLAEVIALAGGLNDYATRDRLFVLRAGPPRQRIRFTYDDVSRGEGPTISFALRQGDVVVAE
jgi:polysaccharide biosynthesis/export protein